MIVIDANLLIYSHDKRSPHYARSSTWIEAVFSSAEPVGLPWQSISAFLRVVTNRRLPGRGVGLPDAVETVEDWLKQPNLRILVPGDGYWDLLRRMILDGQATGPLVSDAEVAALTIEYGGVLHTADRDFARFPGLRWVNPLQS